MTVTITRLYSDYASASRAVSALEAAGVPTKDVSLVANNADNWYSHPAAGRSDKTTTFPQHDSSVAGAETAWPRTAPAHPRATG